MATEGSTLRGTDAGVQDVETLPPRPGLAVIFSGSSPLWQLIALSSERKAGDDPADCELVLGRDNLAAHTGDSRISRRHVHLSYRSGGFTAMDLGSLNGTVIDGRSAPAHVAMPLRHCLRVGDTLLLPVQNLNTFAAHGLVVRDGIVVGPRLAVLHQRIGRIAAISPNLHITGESGSGKEHSARAFHLASTVRSGPFVAVNCATIPESIAERLLFGAKRGAFSGAATDSEGYIQSAHNGTLFLDEVAELHATVQAKLLRVLETREVLAVGAVRPQPVNLRVCSASHRSLHTEVAAGRLREDLYYRIARPSERVPALRERLEEIPWLIQEELQRSSPGISPHVSFVEACVLRHWPGNVRELLVEVRAAVQEASAHGSARLKADHLAAGAGQIIRNQDAASERPSESRPTAEPVGAPSASSEESPIRPAGDRPSKAQIVAALLEAKCNISEAARRLGVHRTQLRRQMEQLGIDLERVRQLGS